MKRSYVAVARTMKVHGDPVSASVWNWKCYKKLRFPIELAFISWNPWLFTYPLNYPSTKPIPILPPPKPLCHYRLIHQARAKNKLTRQRIVTSTIDQDGLDQHFENNVTKTNFQYPPNY